jgi:hypothetical protein
MVLFVLSSGFFEASGLGARVLRFPEALRMCRTLALCSLELGRVCPPATKM